MLDNPATGLRIALGYQSRVGKDTFADRVKIMHGCVSLSFAEKLYAITGHIQRELSFDVKKDPTLLQRQGTELRAYYGDDLFTRQVTKQIAKIIDDAPDTNIIVTDMRSPVEYNALVALGFTTISIFKPDRVIDRDPNHSTEIGLRDYSFDFTILNDGPMTQYIEQIDATIAAIAYINTKPASTGAGSYASRDAGPGFAQPYATRGAGIGA